MNRPSSYKMFLCLIQRTKVELGAAPYITVSRPPEYDLSLPDLLFVRPVSFRTLTITGVMYATKLSRRKPWLIYVIPAALLLIPTLFGAGEFSVIYMMIAFFFMSIGYPTTFGLATKDLGSHTKRAATVLIMAVSGGAVSPVFMSFIAGHSLKQAFIIPVVFYAGNILSTWKGCKVVS